MCADLRIPLVSIGTEPVETVLEGGLVARYLQTERSAPAHQGCLIGAFANMRVFFSLIEQRRPGIRHSHIQVLHHRLPISSFARKRKAARLLDDELHGTAANGHASTCIPFQPIHLGENDDEGSSKPETEQKRGTKCQHDDADAERRRAEGHFPPWGVSDHLRARAIAVESPADVAIAYRTRKNERRERSSRHAARRALEPNNANGRKRVRQFDAERRDGCGAPSG